MRENIFNLISNKEIDLKQEYLRIHKLFEYEKSEYYGESVKEYIQREQFLNWKYRKRFLTIDEMLCAFKIDFRNMKKEISVKKILTYIELIYNLIIFTANNTNYKEGYEFEKAIKILLENISDLLEDMNYKIEKDYNNRYVIVEKDKLTIAVAENKPELASTVIEYRRFAMKGDIEGKKQILKNLSDTIEPLRKKLRGTTYNNIVEDTFFLLNNLNIRHNNKEGEKMQPYLNKITEKKLEKWYDETYDMILCIIIIEKYIDKKDNIKQLKANFK